MGSQRDFVSLECSVIARPEFAICIRHERHGLLRKLRELRLRIDVAALLRQRLLAAVLQRKLGMVSRRGLLVGFALSVGVDALSLRLMGLLRQRRLGMDAGRRMEWLE